MAARQLCLIGPAAMLNAIGETGIHFVTAEVEIGFARMAHRPAADPIIQIEQAVFSAMSALGLAGTSRRGGAGGIGAC